MNTTKIQQKILYVAKTNNPYKNLAMEDYLINYVDNARKLNNSVIALFLWQSKNTIVIGKNQNAQRECNIDFAKQNNIKIARRKTGGGAVFHDLGNLNFSIIASNDLYNQENNFSIIIKSLNKLGLNAKLSGRNDILIDNKKISGSAFLYRKNVSMHHGTLLINSNKDFADKCLTPDKFKLKRHSVLSVKSRIANIEEFKPVTIEKIKKVLSDTFLNEHSNKILIDFPIEKTLLNKFESEYISEKWIYNKSLKDFYTVNTNLGSLRFYVKEKNNRINDIKFETDLLNTDFLEIYIKKLKNLEITKENMLKVSKQLDFDIEENKVINKIVDRIISDIA